MTTLITALVAASFTLAALGILLLVLLAAGLLLPARGARSPGALADASLSTLSALGGSLLSFLVALLATMTSVITHIDRFRKRIAEKGCQNGAPGPGFLLSCSPESNLRNPSSWKQVKAAEEGCHSTGIKKKTRPSARPGSFGNPI